MPRPVQPDYQIGEILDAWTLVHFLGKGGNSEVWRARRTDGTEAAVKFSARKRTDRRYARFRDEITLHQRLEPHPGILPMWDHSLPENPNNHNPSWLSMPEATRIRAALAQDVSLHQVVEAVAEIAETLIWLAAQGVYHRDLKPDNLYFYAQHWVVGDLGLADFPEKTAETSSDERIGPAYFHAPEMLAPRTADPGPADVYALAKTLTVLATGQQWPPLGQQRVGVPNETISTWVQHPGVHLLDQLIEQATATDAARRPTMPEFAGELRAWLTLPALRPGAPVDLTRVVANLQATTRPAVQQQAAYQQHSQIAQRAANRFTSLVQPVFDDVMQQGFTYTAPPLLSRSGRSPDETFIPDGVDLRGVGVGNRQLQNAAFQQYEITAGSRRYVVRSDLAVYFFQDGYANLLVAHTIQADRWQEFFWCDRRLFPLGSAQQDHALVALAEEFGAELYRALYRLNELADATDQAEPPAGTEPANPLNLASRWCRIHPQLKDRAHAMHTLNAQLGQAMEPVMQALSNQHPLGASLSYGAPVLVRGQDPVPRTDNALLLVQAGVSFTLWTADTPQHYPALIGGVYLGDYDDDTIGIVAGYLLVPTSSRQIPLWSESLLKPHPEVDVPTTLASMAAGLAHHLPAAYARFTAASRGAE